jgi:aspartate 1-decarboxylase
MDRIMLKSKIHRATVTGTALEYEGSIAIDTDVLERADVLPGEQVHVFNVNNGQRFVTYAIAAARGSGTVLLNGAAARLGEPGDKVIIVSFAGVPDDEARSFQPRILLVDGKNRVRKRG